MPLIPAVAVYLRAATRGRTAARAKEVCLAVMEAISLCSRACAADDFFGWGEVVLGVRSDPSSP